jgi:carboxylesterase
MGLSMGGTLALRLAELRAAEVAGWSSSTPPSAPTARTPSSRPLLSKVLPSFPASAATSRSRA